MRFQLNIPSVKYTVEDYDNALVRKKLESRKAGQMFYYDARAGVVQDDLSVEQQVGFKPLVVIGFLVG